MKKLMMPQLFALLSFGVECASRTKEGAGGAPAAGSEPENEKPQKMRKQEEMRNLRKDRNRETPTPGPSEEVIDKGWSVSLPAVVAAASLMAAKAAEKKPNILFIMGDDVGRWQVVNRLPRAVGPFKENGEERVHRACRS
jgi:hypothetical protein